MSNYTSIKINTSSAEIGTKVGIKIPSTVGYLNKGEAYTVQFKYIHLAGSQSWNVIVGKQDLGTIIASNFQNIDIDEGITARLCYITFIASEQMIKPSVEISRKINSDDTANTDICEITDISLAMGNLSAYSPNVGDFVYLKSYLTSKINVLAEGLLFSSSKKDIDILNNKISDALGKISVESGKISLAVSKTEITEITNSINLKLDNFNIANRNLILNSSFKQDIDFSKYWFMTTSKFCTVCQDEEFKCNNYNSLKFLRSGLTSASNQYFYIRANKISAKKDTDYTISFEYLIPLNAQVETDCSSIYCGVRWFNTDGTLITTDKKYIKDNNNELVKGKWTRVTYTARSTNSDLGSVSFLLSFDKNIEMYISNLMLVQGDTVYTYSEAPEDTETRLDDALLNMKEDIESQLDGKIETYYQTADPSEKWISTEDKNYHTGDVWYNPNTKLTNRWNGTVWEIFEEAEQLAKTKKTIYTSKPSSYSINDLWILESDTVHVAGKKGEILTATATSTSYNASHWSKKVSYTDDTVANGVKENLETNYYNKTQTDSKIDVLTNSINLSVSEKVEEIYGAIDNIEVGGRNLLKGTSSTYKTYTMSEWNYLTPSYTISDLGLQENDSVTFRVYAKFGNVACGGSARITFYDSQGTNIKTVYDEEFILPNSEGYTKITTKIPSSATKISVGLQRQTSGSGLASFTFQAKEMKLEKGNKPTDWTASPEDIQDQFNALEDLADELQGQIDGKIETWYQSSDPSTAWTTTASKTEHKGDIWHNTSTNVTYRWSGTAWNKLTDADAQEAKSLASSKAQVFTSTPTVPYYKGDLWVQGSTGDILRCVTARTSGSYTASDWNLAAKYTDDTFASSVQQQLNNLSIGGRNLVRNSSFTNGSTYWSLGTNVTLDTSKTFNGHPSIKSSQSGLTSNGWRGCSTLCLPNNPTTLLKDETYTMSFYYYVEDSSNFDYSIGFEIKGIKSGETSTSVVASKNTAVANIVVGKWTRVVNTFTLSVDVTKAFIYAWVGKNGTAWFTDFKLEKGNKCTDWSPAAEDTEDYTDNLIYDLQDQLDNKIETFNQTADPSTSWTTSDLKTQHTGDLWYNPSTMITKRWNGTAWVEQPDAETLAKTKRRVFTATPTVPYDVGDLWVTNLTGTGEIKTCKTAKTSSQSYSSSDWVSPKYTDDTVANNVKNDLANNYSTTTEMNSAINLATNSITSTVSETYVTKDSFNNTTATLATKSEVTQTKKDLTAKFSQTGGINLIRNGSFWDGLNGWSNWGSPSTRYVTTTSLGYRNKLRLVTTGTNQGVSQEISDLEVGTKYTLSAYVNVESGNCVIMINNNGSYVTTVSSGTGKQWLELTFTASHASVTVYLGRSGGGSNGTYDFTAIQLERGSTRSSWSPNANEICEGITTINEEGITVSHSNINATSKMTANGFYIEDSNGETIASLSSKEQWTELKADKVFANNIENVYEGDANLYVDHSKTVVGNGSANSPFSCFYELRDYLEKAPIINKDLTINVVSTGTISDTLYLRGLKGRGAITININKNATYVDKSSSHNFIYLYDVQNLVTINGGRTGYATNDGALISNYKYGVFANNCRYVRVEYIAINTKSSVGDQWGVIFNATNGLTYRVDFCDSPNAIYADRSSQVYDSDSCGNGTIAFYSANGSSIMFGSSQDNGYRPSGSLIKGGGNIVDLGNRGARASFRTAPAVPPTVNQYKDFSFSDYGYYSEGYSNWNSIGYKTVYQGDWGYGNNRGVFTLPNSEINSYLSGATILDGNQITLQRENAGGYSASQTVYLWGTTQTAASGSAPPLTKSYGALGTLAWGERKTFTLPKAFVSDLKAGTIKSVMFYTNDGSNYIKFSAVCTLRLKVNK